MGVPLGCNKFKAKRDGLGFSFESCRGELGAFALAAAWALGFRRDLANPQDLGGSCL